MKVLLIDDDASSMQALLELLSNKRIKAIEPISTLQEGIEILEAKDYTVSFGICNYRGSSVTLLKLFLQLGSNVPLIVFTEPFFKVENLSLMPRDARLHFLEREDLPGFLSLLDRFITDGVLQSNLIPDDLFVKISVASLNLTQPLAIDIYLRLARDRYCRRFSKEDQVDPNDLSKYCRDSETSFIYVKKDELDGWLSSQNKELDSLLDGPTESQKTQEVTEENLEIVHNVVSQLGFTPKVEEIAKKTVALTLKALGNNPQLSDVLRKMRLQDGKYITSHSLMLAEIACALAHKLEWSSAPTFLKLTSAALLHDLTLANNRLARMRSPVDITKSNGFTQDDAQNFKTHPISAAEYARKLRQLPADVDTIVLQHHEMPDGSGFPRGLYHHQISPLASVFIVAQDLLDFFMENEGANDKDIFATFCEERAELYSTGNFKKILDSLSAPSSAAEPMEA